MTDNSEQISQTYAATPSTPSTPSTSSEATSEAGEDTFTGRLIEITAGAVTLPALFHMPTNPHGLVVLTHGIEGITDGTHASTLAIASQLHQASLATLVVDLFSTGEEQLDAGTDYFKSNTSIMEQRIIGISEWTQDNAETSNLSLGYFGAGAAGAAVLIAAAERPDVVKAVVAVGARLDLAEDAPRRILAPTMLITAQQDTNAVQQNQQIMESMTQTKRFEQIAGGNTLFSSQESITRIAQLAGEWFAQHLEPIV
ncbi:MAG TPA: hypothetical protein DHW02_06585 [Ktedonobacter sp.]|nr:hypothetical protein [Ktedonobacter sp.]